MTGETNLSTLISSMQPVLRDGEYVFCALSVGDRSKLRASPVFEFREDEGVTCVVLREDAEAEGVRYTYPCRWITLNIHSSLEAVGFLAVITAELAKHGISINAVSAYYHDHLFVPVSRADDALRILIELARRKSL